VNAFDTLLEWASEVGSGSWQSWREACAHLEIGPSSTARKLAALGHVEFDWIDDRFAAAPPAAVLTLHSSGCLLLTGARRRGQRERLEMLYEEGDYSIDLRSPVPQEGGPETWLVEADVDEIQRFCTDAELAFEVDSGRRMLEALPRASFDSCAEELRPDERFPRKWLNPRLGLFQANIDASTDGLWWVEEYRRDVAFIRRQAEWLRVTTREYGPYLAYPDRSFITHKRNFGVLSVDNQAPLPPLVARAATLQSGRLAKRDGSARHAYVNVDEDLAELIQEKLDAYVRWE
jgi:hypothetical protein